MYGLELGAKPYPLDVTLVRGADFVCSIVSEEGPWPESAVVTLRFNDPLDTVWTASVNDTELYFEVDKAQVDALIDRLPANARVRLRYVDGPMDAVWAQGSTNITNWTGA